MILKHETVENNHYYYVMAWRDNDFNNSQRGFSTP